MSDAIATRLEELRAEIRAERISYGEIAELQSLAEHIQPGDVELLEWAGVPEFPVNPYKKPCAININVPAEMLETVAGYPDETRIDRELSFGFSAVDLRDAATLEWIAALIETKLNYLKS